MGKKAIAFGGKLLIDARGAVSSTGAATQWTLSTTVRRRWAEATTVATLASAPAMPFTTFGVAPQRDGVVLGLSANTAIAEATSIYLRYEGDISGQDSAHAITAGVRMTW